MLLSSRRAQLMRTSFKPLNRYQKYTVTAKHLKATLDGSTLYVDEDVAEALGWTQGTSADGVTLRLSGWKPHYFAITQKGTEAGA